MEDWEKVLEDLREQLDSLDAHIDSLNRRTEQLIYDAAFLKVMVENDMVSDDEDWDYGED